MKALSGLVLCLAGLLLTVPPPPARVASAPVERPAIPAFPGAEGFGSTTPGGRGGRVILVTNLDDSGPGSLRAACEAEGPRVVVFRVAGLITLASPIVVKNPYLTIAGQTAPGDGVCLRNHTFVVATHDVIVRYLRSRLGDLVGEAADAITLGPGGGNDRRRIQAAIDLVSAMPLDANGFRGAVLLKKGRYDIDSSIRISASGVVLRGEGSGEGGTVLVATGTSRRSLIVVEGAGAAAVERINRRAITDSTNGSRRLSEDEAAAFTERELAREKDAPTKPLRVEDAHFTIEGERAWTARTMWSWFQAQMPRSLAPGYGPAITRFAPGRTGLGLTDNLEEVAAAMPPRSVLYHHYGLWYDRRRVNHNYYGSPEMRTGEVWAPFMELPWARSGQGKAWDGLSRFDLTRFNPWFFERVTTV